MEANIGSYTFFYFFRTAQSHTETTELGYPCDIDFESKCIMGYVQMIYCVIRIYTFLWLIWFLKLIILGSKACMPTL